MAEVTSSPESGTRQITCSQCATPVAFAAAETVHRCPACGAVVREPGTGGTYFGLGWRFAIAANVLFLVAAGFTLLCVVNYLADKWFIRRDATIQKSYSLSERSKALVNELAKSDKNLQVYFLLAPQDRQTVEVVKHTTDLLEEYKLLSQGHIDFEEVDLFSDRKKIIDVADKTKMKQEDMEPNEVIFYCDTNKKNKAVKFSELYESPYGGEMGMPQSEGKYKFKGESVLTAGIQSVIEAKPTTICFVKGNDEYGTDDYDPTGLATFDGNLKRRENYETKTISLAAGDIPADADALVMVRPRKKLAPSEVDRLNKYMENGGRLLLLFNSDREESEKQPEEVDELKVLCSNWGLQVGDDFVFEGDDQYTTVQVSPDIVTSTGPAVFSAAEYGFHEITSKLKNSTTWFFISRSVSRAKQVPEMITVTELAKTSPTSWAIPATVRTPRIPKEVFQASPRGPISVAACAEKKTGTGTDAKTGRLVVLGDADGITNDRIKDFGKNDLVTNSLAWLVNKSYQMGGAGIDPVEVEDKKLNLPAAEQNKVLAWTVFAVPGFCLVCGLIAWLLRRS